MKDINQSVVYSTQIEWYYKPTVHRTNYIRSVIKLRGVAFRLIERCGHAITRIKQQQH